jgi:hypothetical protein
MSIFASGFALLIFVFIRKALRNAEQDAESASKMASIKRSLGLQKA